MKTPAFSFLLLISVILTMESCRKNDPETTIDAALSKVSNIFYIPGDTCHKRTLDVYYKPSGTSGKVILFIPGGAWRQGDKDLYATLAGTFVTLYNYTVVIANYRLSNPNDGAAVHPDHVKDVAMAFSWVMKYIGTYGGDPQSVFLFGQSAGGHLVSLLASDDQYLKQAGYSRKNIRGVISMSGAYTLGDLVAFPLNPLGLTADESLMYKSIVVNAFGSYDTATLNPASPTFCLHDSMPPFLIIRTELDMPGFELDAENFYSKMKSLGLGEVTLEKLFRADYSNETWQKATEMAAAEPVMAEYIGHYAEVVAINEHEHLLSPTAWIVDFINNEKK